MPRRIQEPTRTGDDEEYEEEHPAFGVAVVTRGMSSGTVFFQSDLIHRDVITLSIHRATRKRTLHRDWIHPRKELVEVQMSMAQWGALISSVGLGSGVPVTITRTEEDWQVPEIPYQPRLSTSIAEAKGVVGRLVKQARETFAAVEEAINGKLGIRETRERAQRHRLSLEHMAGNAEFAVKSVSEVTEDVVSQAKSDIESHILDAARARGVEARFQIPELDGSIARELEHGA